MKKLLFAICATALLGLTAGCVDPVNGVDNPNYDPAKNVVNTKFVLNIAAADEVGTKQLASTVQRPGTAFRGLSNASLYTYERGAEKDGTIITSTSDVPTVDPQDLKQSYIDLSAMIPSDAISLSGNIANPSTSSNRVLQISLPLNTNSLLFWGMATPGQPREGLSVKDEFGSLTGVVTLNDETPLNTIGSFMDTRLVAKNDLLQVEAMLMTCLNGLMKVGVNGDKPWNDYSLTGKIKASASGAREYDFGTGESIKTLSFKDYLTASASTQKKSPLPAKFGLTAQNAAPLEEILGSLYYQLATFGENEIRAGSGKSILRILMDVYSVCKKGINATPTSTEELIVQKLMYQMVAYLSNFTNTAISITDSGVSLTDLTTWLTTPTIHTTLASWNTNNFISYTYTSAPVLKTVDEVPEYYSLLHFPHDFALPQGACVLKQVSATDNEDATEYARGDIFKYYVDNIDISGMGRPELTMSVEDYSYPVPLCYLGNSPIRVNNSSTFDDTYPNGVGNWISGAWTGWTPNSHVVSTTRGVAMTYNIQYGVALLETKVKYASDVVADGKMNDNNKEHTLGTVPITNENSITLMGILIGGQPNQVGWDYLSVASGDAHYTKMIYDRALTQKSDDDFYYTEIPEDGSASAANYTLVYDNYTGDAKGQYKVYVALEFRNNTGKDFWGLGNMVRADGIFYLIGELSPYATEPTAETEGVFKTVNWPDETTTGQIIPPYKTNGTAGDMGLKVPRVFIQDFMTSATFVLGKNSLKYAYVTVPDLSATRITLGLSVDLKWNTGLNFEDVVLGGN